MRIGRLFHYATAFFDSGEGPFAYLVDGPVEVLNVMTRRARWAARVEILRQDANVQIGRNEIGVLFAAEGEWIAEGGGGTHTVKDGGTGIITQPSAMTLSADPPGAAILALLTPV